jgi:hypothetical protein
MSLIANCVLLSFLLRAAMKCTLPAYFGMHAPTSKLDVAAPVSTAASFHESCIVLVT